MTAQPAPPEFSRPIDLRQITQAPTRIEATAPERAALAARFGLVGIERLAAEVSLIADGPIVTATGRLDAAWTQPCAISGEDLPQATDEPITLRFVPAARTHAPDEEVELTEDDLDEIEYAGTAFDLGEAVAQSLALAIDPFATGPEADKARKAAGIASEEQSGAFAALANLNLKKV